MSEWCTIESDPGVFTELISDIGVKGVQVEELYSLDDNSFAHLKPIYGLIFLFKWTGEEDKRECAAAEDHPDLFFAKQVITNACATQAILSVLLNVADKVDIGTTLTEFRDFTRDFPPEFRGLAISNSETIRNKHNSFSRPDPFIHSKDDDDNSKDKDAFHFIAYVPSPPAADGTPSKKVWELDGLKPGPVELGEGDDWLSLAAPAIQERIAKYSQSEIRFTLLAVVKDRKQAAEESKAQHQARIRAIDAALAGSSPSGEKEDLGDFTVADDKEMMEHQRANEGLCVSECENTIREEELKSARQTAENVRRRHNYVPFSMGLLRILAEKGLLEGMMEKGKKRRAEAVTAAAKRKATAAAAGAAAGSL